MIEGFAPILLGLLSLGLQLWSRRPQHPTDAHDTTTPQLGVAEHDRRPGVALSGWFLVQSAIALLMIAGGTTVVLTAR